MTATHTIARFLTLGGAHVALVQNLDTPKPSGSWSWLCAGCLDHTGQFDTDSLYRARTAANEHAATCRSIPQPEN